MSDWVKRWNDAIAAEPEMPGVWRRRDGGFRIRGRTIDPKTGKLREVCRALPECKRAREAAAQLESDLEAIRHAVAPTSAGKCPRFDDWAVSVLERKVKSGAIASARGREKWGWVLNVHLIPAFGPIFVDKLTREDIETWKVNELLAPRTSTKDDKRARKLSGGRYSPQTANTILEVLRQVTGEASDTFNIADPCRRIDNASTRGHRTYTYEEPNAVKPADVPRFLAEFRTRFPEHYAFVFLGFTTGLRPSSLRPLRRRGPNADIKWDDGKLLVRRSHTRRSEVMESTKTGKDQIIDLDSEQVAVLRWHVDRLERDNARRTKRTPRIAGPMNESDLLFPAAPTRWSHGGGFRSASVLDKPFEQIGEILKLGYRVTPRAMRRTFQDLARAASIGDIVTRAISGHATPEMQRHYSTVAGDEVRAGLAKVIDIATGRERRAA
jgi:hypothetical protein